jgi:hypothetical protein
MGAPSDALEESVASKHRTRIQGLSGEVEALK